MLFFLPFPLNLHLNLVCHKRKMKWSVVRAKMMLNPFRCIGYCTVCYGDIYTIRNRLFSVRSSLRHRGVCLKREPARVPEGPSASWYGILLQPGPGTCRDSVHQGPGVLRLPGGSRHGVLGIQKGRSPIKSVKSRSTNSKPLCPVFTLLY